ncbi:MAG: flagellar basal body rod protein FlgB [Tissierellaceae bacterium]|nr:flagellar basal body rod protein FlgB [Tissierellaceae bacterium]
MRDISYDLIKKTLDVSSLRQSTISSNIANLNTPNYKVNKVEFERFLTEAKEGLNLKKTNSMHIATKNVRDIEPVVEKRTTTSINDNGNNVDIDIEMTELAANEIYYSVLVGQLNSKLSNLNYVINR